MSVLRGQSVVETFIYGVYFKASQNGPYLTWDDISYGTMDTKYFQSHILFLRKLIFSEQATKFNKISHIIFTSVVVRRQKIGDIFQFLWPIHTELEAFLSWDSKWALTIICRPGKFIWFLDFRSKPWSDSEFLLLFRNLLIRNTC